MRLLIALLVVLATTFLYAAEPSSEQNPPQKGYVAPGDRFSLPYGFHFDPRTGILSSGQFPRNFRMPGPSSDLCYTMHSIIVSRPNKNTDEVRVRREQDCTMASVFKVRPMVHEIQVVQVP